MGLERRVNEADQGRIRLALGIERKRCRLGEADRAAYFEVRRRAAHLERTHRKRVGGQAELRRMLVFQSQTGKTHLEVVRSALELYPACSAERAGQPELARGGYCGIEFPLQEQMNPRSGVKVFVSPLNFERPIVFGPRLSIEADKAARPPRPSLETHLLSCPFGLTLEISCKLSCNPEVANRAVRIEPHVIGRPFAPDIDRGGAL